MDSVFDVIVFAINRSIGKPEDVVTKQSFIDFYLEKENTIEQNAESIDQKILKVSQVFAKLMEP